jgi:hypothetical protein
VLGNEKVTHYVHVLERLIEISQTSTRKMLKHMNVFMYIFKMRPEGLIPELKRRTYI